MCHILTKSWSIENAIEKRSCTLEIDFLGTLTKLTCIKEEINACHQDVFI